MRSPFSDTVTLAELPALSTAVPVTDRVAPSAVTPFAAGHEATPDAASLHEKVTVGGVLCHPAAFGAGVTVAAIVGGVVSVAANVYIRTTVGLSLHPSLNAFTVTVTS